MKTLLMSIGTLTALLVVSLTAQENKNPAPAGDVNNVRLACYCMT